MTPGHISFKSMFYGEIVSYHGLTDWVLSKFIELLINLVIQRFLTLQVTSFCSLTALLIPKSSTLTDLVAAV